MGLEDPGLWLAGSVISAVVLAVAKLLHAKIKADSERSLVEIALRETKPEDRPAILRSLAGLRPLSPKVPDGAESSDGSLLPVRLPGRRGS